MTREVPYLMSLMPLIALTSLTPLRRTLPESGFEGTVEFVSCFFEVGLNFFPALFAFSFLLQLLGGFLQLFKLLFELLLKPFTGDVELKQKLVYFLAKGFK